MTAAHTFNTFTHTRWSKVTTTESAHHLVYSVIFMRTKIVQHQRSSYNILMKEILVY